MILSSLRSTRESGNPSPVVATGALPRRLCLELYHGATAALDLATTAAAAGLVVATGLVLLAPSHAPAFADDRLALWAALAGFGLVALRLLVEAASQPLQRAGALAYRVALVADGAQAIRCGPRLHALGTEVVRRFGPGLDRHDVEALADLVDARAVDGVVILADEALAEPAAAGLARLGELAVDVWRLPAAPSAGPVELARNPLGGQRRLLKAVEDRLLAAVLLALTAPLLVAIAVAIKVTSRGPVLFRQRRRGLNRQPFEILKFRTMYRHACDGAGGPVPQACRHDSRVTPLGRWLRRTSLDELPQLINVLRGEMSIVGPRPHATAHDDHYAPLIPGYAGRHRMKPGLTGWAQVHGLRGETDTLAKMARRIRYDLDYIDRWSPALDLRIILRTLVVGFHDPNAY